MSAKRVSSESLSSRSTPPLHRSFKTRETTIASDLSGLYQLLESSRRANAEALRITCSNNMLVVRVDYRTRPPLFEVSLQGGDDVFVERDSTLGRTYYVESKRGRLAFERLMACYAELVCEQIWHLAEVETEETLTIPAVPPLLFLLSKSRRASSTTRVLVTNGKHLVLADYRYDPEYYEVCREEAGSCENFLTQACGCFAAQGREQFLQQAHSHRIDLWAPTWHILWMSSDSNISRDRRGASSKKFPILVLPPASASSRSATFYQISHTDKTEPLP